LSKNRSPESTEGDHRDQAAISSPHRAGGLDLFATYRGDDHFTEATSNLFAMTVERSPTPMTLGVDTGDGRNDSFMRPPTFTVTMPKGATGTVLFFASRYVPGQPSNGCAGGDDGGDRPAPGCEVFGTADSKDAVATLALRTEAVAAGTWVVDAFYWGDGEYAPGDSNIFQAEILRSTLTVHLTTSTGTATSFHPPTFSVILPLGAEGSVTFYDSVDDGCTGGKAPDAACEPLGTAQVIDGIARLTATDVTASPGRRFFRASYSGDANFSPGDSNVVTVNVL
jgi:hypothetical protein